MFGGGYKHGDSKKGQAGYCYICGDNVKRRGEGTHVGFE